MRDCCGQSADRENRQTGARMEDGVLRRSLRRINPFRNNLFRLPATPRLTRSKKVGKGEDVVTDWNFERSSVRSSKGVSSPTSPDTVSLPVINQGPPQPREAEESIHEHMQSLLVPSRNSKYLQLPHTKYRSNGEVSDATWARDRDIHSPHNSTISLLNTGRRSTTKDVRNSTGMCRTPSLRPAYPLNGISRPSSVTPERGNPTSTLNLPPLFRLTQFQSTAQLEEAFIAREWVFREIYQAAVVEKVPLTVIEGCKGAGKTTIFNQIVLNSPFHVGQASDTMDSGCVSDSTVLPSRNYEWLRAVAARLVAYHFCHIQSAASSCIPEFVCNLAAMLAASPVLKSYATILEKRPDLQSLLRLSECLKHDPLDVFRTAIAEPLSQLKSTDQGSLVILIDGIDEAEFHRCEDGRSIGTFLCSILSIIPAWMRIVITSDSEGIASLPCETPRSIRIDDCVLDERVVRDNRMFVEYRIGLVRELEDTIIALRRLSVIDPLADFAEQIVEKANGNMLYIRILLQLVETGKLHLNSLSSTILPDDIGGIYTLCMDLTFLYSTCFERIAPVLSILLASLRPIDQHTLLHILNAGGKQTDTDENELNQILTVLSPLLSFAENDTISLHHPAFREWLLKVDTQGKYATDARRGHILIALWLSDQAPLESSQLFELAHHLLKAHPYKYMYGEYVPELTSSKDGQILWIQKSTKDMAAALLDDRNMFYPNTKVSRLLLVAGADPSYSPCPSSSDSFDSLSVSQRAVAAGNWPLVSLLMHYGAGLHPDTGPCLLAVAARYGRLEIARQLCAIDSTGIEIAVREAALNGHSKILSYLLSSHWPTQHLKLLAVEDALCAAASEGHTSICQQIVDSFQTIDISRGMRVACENGRAAVVQFLLSRGASLSSLDWPSDKPALHCAVESGSWDLVVAVLALPESDIEKEDSLGRTPLICAAKCGHVGLVDMLINKGGSLNHRDAMGWTALMHAVRQSHTSTVQLLLDRDAEIHGTDIDGNSIAHVACAHANRTIIDRLLEKGMLFEDRERNGDRPIECAIRNRNRPALEALLRRGARLRSSTWNAAWEHDPEALFILLAKLLEDADSLFRKKRLGDSMHRLHYALDKLEGFLTDRKLRGLHARFLRVKCQVLIATARVHRRDGQLEKAIHTLHQAGSIADSDTILFEVLLLRAKCNFDCHDVDRARADALAAAKLQPNSEEARHLLNTLQLPTTNISRL